MHSILYSISIEDERSRNSALINLKVESEDSRTDRGSFIVRLEGNQVIVEVIAEDLVMLRAFSNSVFRILKTCLEVGETIDILP